MIKMISVLLLVISIACQAMGQDEPRPLCVNGRPAPRSPNVAYGNRHCPSGMIRDHAWPLSSGGPDTWENVWCQPAAESYKKDALERRWAEDLCAGRIFPKDGLTPEEQAHDYFVGGQWRGEIK